MSDETGGGIELISCRYAETIRELAPVLNGGVALQSVAVATLQTLRGVIGRQRQAAEAAISLAQGEKLEQMIGDSQATAEAISGILNPQGVHMLRLIDDETDAAPNDPSWWFALTEVLESIDDGAARLRSLASCQPKGSPARKLTSVVLRLLRAQHQQLISEADDWIN